MFEGYPYKRHIKVRHDSSVILGICKVTGHPITPLTEYYKLDIVNTILSEHRQQTHQVFLNLQSPEM